MSGPGRPVDPATIDRLTYALEVARGTERGLQHVHEFIDRILTQSSLGSNYPQIDPRNPPVIPPGTPPVCQPITTDIPTTYGAAYR